MAFLAGAAHSFCPAMGVAAVAEATRRWPEFVAAFSARDGEGHSVKAPITRGERTEFIWIEVDRIEPDRVALTASAALALATTVVGAAPNYDSDWRAQIRRIFEMAREFDVDIDMHLDSGASAEELHTLLVCDLTEKYKWGGRVAVGHVHPGRARDRPEGRPHRRHRRPGLRAGALPRQ
mgnify:CR=1 FL=1